MAFALVCILGLVALGIVAAVVSHFQGGDDEIIVGHDCASCSSKDSGECKIACLMERQRLLHESSEPLDLTEETQEVAPQMEIETNLADASANRRTKQEQRPSLFGLCLARRRKTEGQNEIENQIHQLRLIKYKIETNNYGKGQTGVHHCRGQRVCRCIQAELTTNRRTSEHNAKLA